METAAAEQHQASGTCYAIVLSIWFLRKTQASRSTNMDFVRSLPSSEAKRANCQSTATISGRLLSQVKCDMYIYITYSCSVMYVLNSQQDAAGTISITFDNTREWQNSNSITSTEKPSKPIQRG